VAEAGTGRLTLIDFNSGQDQPAPVTADILRAIEAGLGSRRQSQRRYLGASSLGDSCERRIQLNWIRAQGLPHAPEPSDGGRIEPQTQRIFDIGHNLEDLAIRWLKEAGFTLKTRGRDGEQIGFMTAKDRFGGHCDGVLMAGPAAMAYPALFEHKSLNRRNWQDVAKKGVTVAKPVYAAQLALYQSYLNLPNPALFMATNKDNAELYFELVQFNGKLAQESSDRAVRIIKATDAGDLLPKPFAQADNMTCRSCGWRGFCWGTET
jgi:hypothetical protein